MTYRNQSENNKLSITLEDLNIDENAGYISEIPTKIKSDLFEMITLTPTKQSHLGVKFSSYSKLNSRNTNEFLEKIFKGLCLDKVFLFKTFSDNKIPKKDLREDVLNSDGTSICLRCDSGIKESLFMGVRNAIAHGNIISQNGYVILYSVADDHNEYTSNVNFYLKIKELKNLLTFFKVLKTYK